MAEVSQCRLKLEPEHILICYTQQTVCTCTATDVYLNIQGEQPRFAEVRVGCLVRHSRGVVGVQGGRGDLLLLGGQLQVDGEGERADEDAEE